MTWRMVTTYLVILNVRITVDLPSSVMVTVYKKFIQADFSTLPLAFIFTSRNRKNLLGNPFDVITSCWLVSEKKTN